MSSNTLTACWQIHPNGRSLCGKQPWKLTSIVRTENHPRHEQRSFTGGFWRCFFVATKKNDLQACFKPRPRLRGVGGFFCIYFFSSLLFSSLVTLLSRSERDISVTAA
jgi:hypothetical protein